MHDCITGHVCASSRTAKFLGNIIPTTNTVEKICTCLFQMYYLIHGRNSTLDINVKQFTYHFIIGFDNVYCIRQVQQSIKTKQAVNNCSHNENVLTLDGVTE